MTETAETAETAQFQVAEISPSYWHVTFANGPINLLMAHWDFTADLRFAGHGGPR